MVIQRTNNEIRFSFTRKEWEIEDGNRVENFISALKDRIPHAWRTYEGKTRTWRLNRHLAEKVFDELREKYFGNPGQGSLF